jgi:hypothetical protein
MPVFDIPLERCHKLQQTLREILLRSPDPHLALLLQDIDAACLPSSIDGHQIKKRTASQDLELSTATSRTRKVTKFIAATQTRNTRNDSRKRGRGSNAGAGPFTVYEHEADQIRYSQRQGDVTGVHDRHREKALDTDGVSSRTNDDDDLQDDSDLTPLSSDTDTDALTEMSTSADSNTETQTFKRIASKAKQVKKSVRQPKGKPWEIVQDIRELTEKAAKVLQSLASIGEQANFALLLALKERLSCTTPENQEPKVVTLQYLVNRCHDLEVKEVEHKFMHIVALMQLSLWLDQ